MQHLAGGLQQQLERVVLGQREVVEQVVVALLAQGHALLEGPPGTAKTLLARALAMSVAGRFRRIQFTPDLMPADVLGVSIYQQARDRFEFQPGPVFCDILLADEINRAPAKTQSGLLEVMQERQVTMDGQTHPLSEVFTVLATQNPIEFEGTYPLPEAQLDRFMLKIRIDYPEHEAEDAILHRVQEGFDAARGESFQIEPLMQVEELAGLRRWVRSQVHIEPEVVHYITSIIRATRNAAIITVGASPRAAVNMLEVSRAMALVRGRDFVTPDDVRDLAAPVLRHRIILSPEAEIEGTTADQCIAQVLTQVPVPRQ